MVNPMPVFLFKSLLAIVVALLALLQMYTMFELLGRTRSRFSPATLKKIHRANGIFFIALVLFIAYLCLRFIYNTQTEFSPRAALHGVLALSVLVLLPLKVSFVRYYRQFYGQVRFMGLITAIITMGMVGTSAGYYLLVTDFGRNLPVTESTVAKSQSPAPPTVPVAKKEVLPDKGPWEKYTVAATDLRSIKRGKVIYEDKCDYCHDAYSNRRRIGPGHKRILKNPFLPESRRPAVPTNIARQILSPYNQMPAFAYLSEYEINDLISYLNTL